MPFSPDKFQIPTFSLLFQLLIFQGRNNYSRHGQTPSTSLGEAGSCHILEGEAWWSILSTGSQPTVLAGPFSSKSSWYAFLQALLCHHSQQINSSLQHTKPTLTTPSLHAGVCSLPWFPTGKQLKIPPPVPRFSTNRACCD